MYWLYTKIEKYGPQLGSPELNGREKVSFRNKKQNLNELPGLDNDNYGYFSRL